jgi:hypothetical protein
MYSSPFFIPLLFTFLAIISPSAIRLAQGCSFHSADVTYVANKSTPGFYTTAEVSDHVNQVIFGKLGRYIKDGSSSLSCVDARSDDPLIGTPGGDLAEFAMGLYVYNSLTNNVQNYTSVQLLFRKFMDQHISASRPFYFHTDDSRLKQVFTAVGNQLNQIVSILPIYSAPASSAASVWLTELVKSYAQGCGHIRLMIDSPSLYGLSNANIVQWLIRAFYEELWAADTSAKRAKLSFVVKLGPLQGKAVAVISNSGGNCSGYSPAIPPNLGGSSLFVYTPSAATAFRTNVMLPFFASQGGSGWNSSKFQTDVDSLFNTQLGATLAQLVPANQSSIISVGVKTADAASANTAQQNQPAFFFPKAASSTPAVTWLLVALVSFMLYFL